MRSFVSRASARFRTLGVVNPITLEISQQLHDKKIDPAKILAMVETVKELDKMGDALVNHSPTPQLAAPNAGFRQAVTNGAKMDRQVVGDGKFTGNLLQENVIDPALGALPHAR